MYYSRHHKTIRHAAGYTESAAVVALALGEGGGWRTRRKNVKLYTSEVARGAAEQTDINGDHMYTEP